MKKRMIVVAVANRMLIMGCLLLMLIACEKEASVEPAIAFTPPTCLITKTESRDFISTYHYDQDNLLLTIHEYYDTSSYPAKQHMIGTLTRDKNKRVTKLEYDRGNGLKMIYTFNYDDQGRWIKTSFTNIPATDYNYTIVASYNSQGLLAKTAQASVSGPNTSNNSYEFEYTDGLITKTTFTGNHSWLEGTSTTVTTYEYNLNQEAQWNEIDLLGCYMSGTSPLTKHRINKITLHGQSPQITQVSYQLNDKGYVTKKTLQTGYNNGGSWTRGSDHTYSCK